MGGKILRISILTVIAVAMLWSLSMGHETDDSTRAEIFDNVRELTENYDFMRAIAFVQGLGDPQDVSKTYENLVIDYYWKSKSLQDLIAVARAGLQYCLTEAERMKKENPEKAKELKTTARRISYNLASFT